MKVIGAHGLTDEAGISVVNVISFSLSIFYCGFKFFYDCFAC